jgi:hypothetical protein
MMYIISRRKLNTEEQVCWHVNEPSLIEQEDVKFVTEVQADCDELDWIRERFLHLPIHNRARVQRWFGDHAKFIAAHLAK